VQLHWEGIGENADEYTVVSVSTLHYASATSFAGKTRLILGCMSLPLPSSICFIPPSTTRGHNLKITIPILLYSTSKQNFISRTAVLWNGLPVSLLCTLSPITFRRQIAAYM